MIDRNNQMFPPYGEYYPKLVRMFDSIYSSYLNLKAPDSQLYFDTLQLIKKNNR